MMTLVMPWPSADLSPNARDGIKGQIAGMQAAYRLFLDRVEL